MGAYSQIVVITDHRRDDPAKGEAIRKLYEFCKRELYGCEFSLCKSPIFDSIYAAYPKSATIGQLAAKFPTFGWEDDEHSGQGTVLLYREDQDDEWHGLHSDGSPLAHDVMPDLRTIDISEAGYSLISSLRGALSTWTTLENKPPELLPIMNVIAGHMVSFGRVLDGLPREPASARGKACWYAVNDREHLYTFVKCQEDRPTKEEVVEALRHEGFEWEKFRIIGDLTSKSFHLTERNGKLVAMIDTTHDKVPL
jgi:hypothetical protein